MLIVQRMGFDLMRNSGIILLDKPKGMTSHDCVNRIRRIFHTKKVGHTGTLDPDATGVLVVCINDATKIIQFMEFDTKTYEATISIGTSTSTEDASGEVVERDDSIKTIERSQLIQVLKQFIGPQTQIPPMISSIKVNGKKLYEYARANETVERPKRSIEVFSLELLSDDEVFSGKTIEFSIRTHVSKGTYIRTLAKDIGQALGYPAHLKTLRRTQSGAFTIDQCVPLETLEQGNYHVLPMIHAFQSFPKVVADESLIRKIKNGQKLKSVEWNETIVFINEKEHVLAIYAPDPKQTGWLKPVRVIMESEADSK